MATKSVPDTETWFEVWYQRDLGPGIGRYQKATTEGDAHDIADALHAEGHPNIEVLAVTTTRKAVSR